VVSNILNGSEGVFTESLLGNGHGTYTQKTSYVLAVTHLLVRYPATHVKGLISILHKAQQALDYNRFFGTIKVCWEQGMGRYVAWSTSLCKAYSLISAEREVGKYNLEFLKYRGSDTRSGSTSRQLHCQSRANSNCVCVRAHAHAPHKV
jgi:hypothetical protein